MLVKTFRTDSHFNFLFSFLLFHSWAIYTQKYNNSNAADDNNETVANFDYGGSVTAAEPDVVTQ